jgi:hypothetical protein
VFKRECYLAGINASAALNLHLKEGAKPLTPFDFVPGRTATTERDKLKHNLLNLFVAVEGQSPEAIQALRIKTIQKLEAQGYEDAEQILEEMFPRKDK